MADTIDEMFNIQEDKLKVMERSRFELLLSDFCSKEKVNPLFHDKTLSDVFNAISKKSSKKTNTIADSSPIILLVKETSNVCMRIFIDQLFEKQQGSRQNYEIIGEHYCSKRNYLTKASKQVLCSFLYSLGKHSKDIRDYLTCIEYDLEEKIYPKGNIREPVSIIFKDVFDLLQKVVIGHNLIFIIQNAEYLDDYFYMLVRRLESEFPKYIKLVLTVSNIGKGMKSLSMLNNALVIYVKNREFMPSFCSYLCNKFINNPDGHLLKALLGFCGNDLDKLKAMVRVIMKESDDRKAKLEKASVLKAISEIKVYGHDFKVSYVKATCKRIKSSKGKDLINQILLFLIEAKGPLSVYILESWLTVTSPCLDILKEFCELFLFSTETLTPSTIIKLKYKSVWKEVYTMEIVSELNHTINTIINQCLNNLENDTVIDMHTYYRFNVVYHFLKLQKKQNENPFISFKWLFSQIKTFQSFDLVISDLERILYMFFDEGINTLKNHMHILENIYMNKKLLHNEFITQIQSRLLDNKFLSLQQLLLDIHLDRIVYLKPSHSSLKENANIEHIMETDSPVIAAFITNEYFVYASKQGFLYIHLLTTHELLFRYFIASGILVLCYTKNNLFLVSGEAASVFLWRINTKNPENVLKDHTTGAHKIVYINDTFFLVGNNNTLYKGVLKPFEKVAKNSVVKTKINNLEALRVKDEDSSRVLLLVGLITGSIVIFDSDIKEIIYTIEGDKELMSIYSLNDSEGGFASITIDNEIKIYDSKTLALTKSFSIFRVDQDELKQVFILEEMKIIVSIERRIIRIYKLKKCELVDEWLYMFKEDIVIAVKSFDDKYLLIGDNDGRVCIFNMAGELKQRHANNTPSHKKECSINFILTTSGDLDVHAYLITCSQEREVKVWSRDNCKYIKTCNLTSIASILFLNHQRI